MFDFYCCFLNKKNKINVYVTKFKLSRYNYFVSKNFIFCVECIICYSVMYCNMVSLEVFDYI